MSARPVWTSGASFSERRHELAGTWLRSLEVTRVVMEATGRYHRRVYQCLRDRGFEVVLVNPLAAGPALRRSVGPTTSTLARIGTMVGDLEPVAPQDAFLNNLEDLLVSRLSTLG